MSIFDIPIPYQLAKWLQMSRATPRGQQLRVLKKLLSKARYTEFGQKYGFDSILMAKHAGKAFQQRVPTYDYNRIYQEFWYKTLEGIPDVCWPGPIKYFALSSGTSEAASKYIPITKDLIR
ncbi:MAG: GH3 auxin-responsive promoter family protein, partial [Chitinophagaceae bacterium]|nr:GH3 auxin-responsive promoter family protein [Chitinophagaceae bacterium]